MKISLNSIRRFNEKYGCAGDIAPQGVEALVAKINAQLGAIDEVLPIGEAYKGIIIARVMACEKHTDADKLHVCLIDDGGVAQNVKRDKDGWVQVVCGAPNVREGLTVAWLPPGSTVPESYGKDPFVLEIRELRGVVSNGMLASPKELGLSDSHDGILEIHQELAPGTDFAEAFGLNGDVVLDIENKMFTHRPDLFGFLGVSRELAGIHGLSFKSPAWYVTSPEFPAKTGPELKLSVDNEVPELVPRFTMAAMSDIQVWQSPVWLQVELAKYGQKPINNIVDYTNYFMLLTGQPLHAYDYDKVAALSKGDGAHIVVRQPKKGEKVKLLNGKEIEPRQEAVMIATNKQLIGVGGVMGGSDTEVDFDTKNIILECGNFDMYSTRRTAMAHGLFTDAGTRFTKGQSPLQNLAVLAKIVDEISQYAGGNLAGEVVDLNNLPAEVLEHQSLHAAVTVSAEFINSRLGINLPAAEIATLLQNVEFNVQLTGEDLVVQAPFWRADIELPEDIVEEVGRLYGYDHLPLMLPDRIIEPTKKNRLLDVKAGLRAVLVKAGANELLTYSFVHGDLLDKVGQDKSMAFQLSNALSPDLQYYRLSLTPSLLEKVHPNHKAGHDAFAIFELGKAHVVGIENQEGIPEEFERLALVVSADKKAASRFAGAAYYQARTYLVNLLQDLGLTDDLRFVPPENETDSDMVYYDNGRAASVYVGETLVGCIGEYKSLVRRALKLPDFCAGFELDLTQLLKLQKGKPYLPLPRFPKVTQDITLRVPRQLTYQQVFDVAWEALKKDSPRNVLADLDPLDIYQPDDNPEFKNISLRLRIADYERTLTDQEVNKLLDAVAAEAKDKLKAERV